MRGPRAVRSALCGLMLAAGGAVACSVPEPRVAFGPLREAVVLGRSKRISGGSQAPPLLFDLASDPGESRPLSPKEGDPLARMLTDYRRQQRESAGVPEPDPDTLRALQELGYLEEVGP